MVRGASRSALAALLGARVVALVVALVGSGCVVAPPSREVWPCVDDAQCLDGYACVARAGAAGRICERHCTEDSACGDDGLCTTSGICALRCSFAPDGTPIRACPEGLACVRRRLPLGADPEIEGLCGTIPACTTSADCGADMECASSTDPLLRGLSNLICMPAPSEAGCPPAWVLTTSGCLPRCTADASACPAGMSCRHGSLAPLGARIDESACVLGLYGAPCLDDAECFVGRCEDVGGGSRQCTETCESARRLFLVPDAEADPCFALGDRAGPLGERVAFRCEEGAGSPTCVARGGVGSGCDAEALSSGCAVGLECRLGTCSRACGSDADCEVAGDEKNPLATGYCDEASRLCAPRLPDDALCALDAECVSGLCANPAFVLGEYRCTRPRRPGTPCSRNVECVSGRCTDSRFGVPVCQ